MYKRNCKGCLWEGKCYSTNGCDHYDPLDDGAEMGRYIEERREEFYEEWLAYVAEE